MSSNYAGCPSENYDSTDKNCCDGGDGDGDGDGDGCVAIPRNMVFDMDFNSAALGQDDAPGDPPFVIPVAAAGVPINFTPMIGAPAPYGGHNSWVGTGPLFTEIAISDTPSFDVPFEMTLNYSLSQTAGAGANDLTFAFEADYGGGYLPLRTWLNSIGGSNPDELLGQTFQTMVPSLEMAIAMGIPGATSTPTVRVTISRSGSGALVEINNRQLYTKQCFPKFTAEAVENCEVPTPDNCPAVDTGAFQISTGEVSDINPDGPPIGLGAGVSVLNAFVSSTITFDDSVYEAHLLFDGVDSGVGVNPVPPGPPANDKVAWAIGPWTQPAPAGVIVSLRVREIASGTVCFEQNITVST